uniref:Uncharacterized protein n=1 Tax=Anguilla anguilla TaxID=7936 RepID=A0A0E9TW88_ANGAN
MEPAGSKCESRSGSIIPFPGINETLFHVP